MKFIALILSLTIFFHLHSMDEKALFKAQETWLCNNEHFKSVCSKGAQDLSDSSLQLLIAGIQSIFEGIKHKRLTSAIERQAHLVYQTKKLLNDKKLNLSEESKILLQHPLHNNNLIQITTRAYKHRLDKDDIRTLQYNLIKIFGSEDLLADVKKLTTALLDNKEDRILQLLTKGTPINAIVSPTGATALSIAVCHGWVDTVELLISLPGIDINAQELEAEFTGYAALHHAITENDKIIAEMLLSQPHMNINLQTASGESAAMIATKYSHTEILKMILDKFPQADLSLANNDGQTALDLAKKPGVRLLLEVFEV